MLEIEQVSRLIRALSEFSVRDAGELFEESPADTYVPPILSSWDALKWFELIQDWDIVDFLLSDDRDARRLVISLQALLIWYGQQHTDKMHKRLHVMSIIN